MVNDFNKVAVHKTSTSEYPLDPPFNPSTRYPEYPFSKLSNTNEVYHSVRETIRMLGLDNDRYGATSWNPFGDIIRPGEKVVIKATLTNDRNLSGDSALAVITHGSVIRPIIDYCLIADAGEVVVCDGPIPRTNFDIICELTGLRDTVKILNQLHEKEIELVDLRNEVEDSNDLDISIQKGDKAGYIEVDLGSNSELSPILNDCLTFGSVSSIRKRRSEPQKFHNTRNNVYSIARTVLDADVVINISKLKTHRKVGNSLGLKTVVGIDNNKYRIPHYRSGIDDMPQDFINKKIRRTYKRLVNKILKKLNYKGEPHIVAGNWYGNDTVWRSVIDLNKILFYADSNGKIHDRPQRKIFSLIDGIIGGERFGPLAPKEKKTGLIIGGADIAAVDAIASAIMGFDYRSMPVINNTFNLKKKPISFVKPEDIQVISNKTKYEKGLSLTRNDSLKFRPTAGWKNHIELS